MSGPAIALIVIAAAAAALLLVLLVLYLFVLRKKGTERMALEKGNVTRVDATLEATFGDIEVAGGASGLAEAEFTSNIRGFKPDLRNTASGGEGRLELAQKAPNWLYGWLGKTRGKLLLNDSLPLKLNVDLGAGMGRFELGSLSLEELKVKAKAGLVEVDATGDMALLKKVEITQAAGDLELAMNGDYAVMESIEIRSSVGNARVSLLGAWRRSLDCSITSKAGEVRVDLPSGIGVKAEVKKGSGDFVSKGMTRMPDGTLTNQAYGKSEVTLSLSINSSMGDVRLDVPGPSAA